MQDLKIHPFYYWSSDAHFSQPAAHLLSLSPRIYAIYPRLDNHLVVQRFEHAFMFVWQCVELYHRTITQRDSPVSRDPALSIYVENFTGHPFVSTSTRHDEMESRDRRCHKQARTCESCAMSRRWKLFTPCGPDKFPDAWNVLAWNMTGSRDASFFPLVLSSPS